MRRIVVGIAAVAVALGMLPSPAVAQQVEAGTLPAITWDYIYQYNVMDMGKAVGDAKLTRAKVTSIMRPQCKSKGGIVMVLSVDGAEAGQSKGVLTKVDVPKKATKPGIMDPAGSNGTWNVGCKIRYRFTKAPVGNTYSGTIQGLQPVSVSLKELQHYKYFLFSTSYPGTPCTYNSQQGLVCS